MNTKIKAIVFLGLTLFVCDLIQNDLIVNFQSINHL